MYTYTNFAYNMIHIVLESLCAVYCSGEYNKAAHDLKQQMHDGRLHYLIRAGNFEHVILDMDSLTL